MVSQQARKVENAAEQIKAACSGGGAERRGWCSHTLFPLVKESTDIRGRSCEKRSAKSRKLKSRDAALFLFAADAAGTGTGRGVLATVIPIVPHLSCLTVTN